MPITVFVTKDYEHMSRLAADIVKLRIVELSRIKKEIVLGLATGNSPAGTYKHLAQAANAGEFDSGRIRSFNLDEYIGLTGENAQERSLHPESFGFYMIRDLFGLLKRPFIETNFPAASLIDQKPLIEALKRYPEDWTFRGAGGGKSVVIKANAKSPYLAWVKKETLDGYARKIRKAGGIDMQVIGVGGRGHVAFHESGIPFKGSSVMLVKLDDITVAHAVADGHFSSKRACPRYALSMGVGLIFRAREVVLLANGERKVEAVTRSLLGDVTPDMPISYGQRYSENGGRLIYVLDKIAARELLANKKALARRKIVLDVRT